MSLPTKHSEQPIPRIVKALLCVGNLVVHLDRETGNQVGLHADYPDRINNLKGASIKTDVFLSPSYAHISAVVYSYADWINVPSEPGKEFMLVHNPMATNPLPRGWLSAGKEYWMEGSELRIREFKEQSSGPN